MLAFGSPAGAQSQASLLDGEYAQESAAVSPVVHVSGDNQYAAYVQSTPSGDGGPRIAYATAVGDLALDVHYSGVSPSPLSEFLQWSSTEFALLRTAPSVASKPAGTQKQTATCSMSLAACLPAAPAGSSPWTNDWGSLPTVVTADQFVTNFWSGTDGFNAARDARLSEDGLASIAKTTWHATDGSQVDDLVFNFTTAVGALSWDHYLTWLEDTDVSQFPIPGAPGALGFVRTPDSDGFGWSLAIGVSGTTVVQYWYVQNKKADPQATATAAAAQMQLIANTSVTQTVPAQAVGELSSATVTHAGAPPCSAIASCLVTAPPGAITPTSGYRAQTEVTAAQFAAQHPADGSTDEQTALLAGTGSQQITHVA